MNFWHFAVETTAADLHLQIGCKIMQGIYFISSIVQKCYKRRPRLPPFLLMLADWTDVISSILPIFTLDRASEWRADWASGSGVFVPLPLVALVLVWQGVMPISLHLPTQQRKWVIHLFQLYFHTSRDSRCCFPVRKICREYKCVLERWKSVCNTNSIVLQHQPVGQFQWPVLVFLSFLAE